MLFKLQKQSLFLPITWIQDILIKNSANYTSPVNKGVSKTINRKNKQSKKKKTMFLFHSEAKKSLKNLNKSKKSLNKFKTEKSQEN